MKRSVTVLALLLAVTSDGMGQLPSSGQSPNQLGSDKARVTKALESGSIVPSDSGQEYFLAPRTPAFGDRKDHAWGVGDQPVSPDEALKVQVQVGLYKGKPMSVLLAVPKRASEAAVKDFIKLLSEGIKGGTKLPGQPFADYCKGEEQCVKKCKDSSGREYCCKWECIRH